MRLLVDLYLETGDEKFLEPLPRAIAWFKRSEIAPGTWARMYELGTNTPIYGDRDGKIKYRLEDLSPERQTGYSWRGTYGVPGAISHYEEVKTAGRAAVLEKRKKAEADAASAKGRAARAQALEPRVRAAIAALDAQGRWIVKFRGSDFRSGFQDISLREGGLAVYPRLAAAEHGHAFRRLCRRIGGPYAVRLCLQQLQHGHRNRHQW